MSTQLLNQSLLNLLNNAADASSTRVDIKSRWDNLALHIEIIDDGEGLTAEATQRAGEAFFTSKIPGQGFGIGLFLLTPILNDLVAVSTYLTTQMVVPAHR